MYEYQTLNDPGTQRQIVQKRVLLLGALIVIPLSVVLLRYHSLQIKQHEKFATLSDENRVHVRSVPPGRGLIFDRNGVILAENRPSYTLSIVRERTEDIDALIVQLNEFLHFEDSELERFEIQRKRYGRAYQGIPLRFHLTEEDVALLAVNEFRLPGIEVEVELVRHYPFKDKFAHSVGYVGRINSEEQADIDPDLYEGTHVIGKVGVEKQYENLLLGSVGYEYVETDARGKVLRVLEREDAIPGFDLHLGIDSRLQLLLYKLLEGHRASAVALDVETGAVLAMASTPSFDANLFVAGISHANYDALLNDIGRPLYDRTLLGQYPPGSTIKPLFALAGLATGAVTPEWEIADRGEFSLKGQKRVYRDWKKGGHGVVDMRKAIEQSCDIYFYTLGRKVGIDVLSKYAGLFGLGRKTDIDMPSESTGIMPSRSWKKGARGIAWYPGDTINTSIGQGFMLTTPLQLAQMAANIARKGNSVRPHVLHSANDQVFEFPLSKVADIDDEHWQSIHSAMEDVVHNAGGTAAAIGRNIGYRMAGKSGTAQVVGIPQDAEYNSEELELFQRDHALWVSFAPANNPKIAVAVVVENGEHSSENAQPAARALIDQWFEYHPELLKGEVSSTENSQADSTGEPFDAI